MTAEHKREKTGHDRIGKDQHSFGVERGARDRFQRLFGFADRELAGNKAAYDPEKATVVDQAVLTYSGNTVFMAIGSTSGAMQNIFKEKFE